MKQGSLFNLTIGLITIVLIAMAIPTSSSGDEATQVKIGNNILKFYQSLGQDETALKPQGADQLQYYGSSFDTFCQFWVNALSIKDVYAFRHGLNGLVGALIILFIGLFTRLLKNETIAILAMVLAFFSPQLLGHSFNNPKDIPFALGYVMSLYFMAKWFLNPESPDRKNLIYLTLSLAFTNSIRMGGVVLYGYLGLFLLLSIWSRSGIKNTFSYKRQIMSAVAVVVVSYFLGILLWPFGLLSPIKHPFEALAGFEQVSIGINQLFDGLYVESKNLPRIYLIRYILITTPLLILTGTILFIWQQVLNKSWRKNLIHYLLLFAILFPLVYIMYKNSNVYGGWRHVLFVYPPMVILSALGLGWMYDAFEKGFPKKQWMFFLVIALGLAHPIRHTVVNYPYVYIYFNEMAGGVSKAYGNYEMDYYYHSTKATSTWLKSYLRKNHGAAETMVIASNHADLANYLKDEANLKPVYSRFYNRHEIDWDYYICVNTYIHPWQLKYNYWPPAGTIHTIDVDGKPICAIVKRPSKYDFFGFTLLTQNRKMEAAENFKKYLKVDSTNCLVLASLANCYISPEQLDTCFYYANEAMKYYQNYPVAMDMMGRVYLSRQQYDKAIETYDILIKENPNFYMAYYFEAYIYFQKKEYTRALKKAEMCLTYHGNFKPAFNMIGEILKAQGDLEGAKAYFEKAR
ncbi:MAG: tetratricopeptide repeat protein [Saprospiraceae bacterium]|nr:tetratricopeptide repeat protein [Saprospiraceae bacterium]